jgi:hypothetical protein
VQYSTYLPSDSKEYTDEYSGPQIGPTRDEIFCYTTCRPPLNNFRIWLKMWIILTTGVRIESRLRYLNVSVLIEVLIVFSRHKRCYKLSFTRTHTTRGLLFGGKDRGFLQHTYLRKLAKMADAFEKTALKKMRYCSLISNNDDLYWLYPLLSIKSGFQIHVRSAF